MNDPQTSFETDDSAALDDTVNAGVSLFAVAHALSSNDWRPFEAFNPVALPFHFNLSS